MPAKTLQAVTRQWELLKRLPSRPPGKTARELADSLAQGGCQVSKRTVERDLNELERLFPIDCNDRGTPYGWHWLEDAHFDLPGLTLAEAMSTRLLEDYLKPLLPASIMGTLLPRFREAKKKLQAMPGNPMNGWADKIRVVTPGLNLLPPRIEPDVQETVYEALLADEQVKAMYHSIHKEQASAMELHPLGLIQRGPVTYLVATVFDYENVRLFAMHRIKEAKRLSRPCRRPENFSLDAYLATGASDFGDGEHIRFKAVVNGYLADRLRETPLSEDMELMKQENGCLLTCSLIASWQLHWWILSQGDEIEVLEPKGLRQSIAQTLRDAAGVYQPNRIL